MQTKDIELTREQYDRLVPVFRAANADVFFGEHQGGTFAIGSTMLCDSDGAFWLAFGEEDEDPRADLG